MRAAAGQNELHRVVALREGIKGVATRAFKINILGLNAILLAKQFGEQARGFGVISSELRDFSQSLTTQMRGLSENSVQLVDFATRQLKLTRQMALLSQAGHTSHPHMQAAHRLQAAAHTQLSEGILQAHARMIAWVEAAHRSCLFGTVIARSARIEAAHAHAAGASLTDASNAFAEHVNQILPNLEKLRHTLGAQV